jgi:hypothetical protein
VAETVYFLCALTSLACAALLARAYRRSPSRLLLWSSVCFAGLALNSILLIIDLIVLPHTDLRLLRLAPAGVGLLLLLWALITEGD